MAKFKRSRRYVDRNVQGRLVLAAMRYWTLSVFLVAGLSLVGWLFVYPGIGTFISSEATAAVYLPMFVTAVAIATLLAPLALWDLVRLSHRFAGPMVRLRRALAELSAGGDPGAIRFRKKDFWHEMADQYNELREYVLELRAAKSENFAGERQSAATTAPEKRELADPVNI
jgi:hypothetical protein